MRRKNLPCLRWQNEIFQDGGQDMICELQVTVKSAAGVVDKWLVAMVEKA